MDDHRGGNNGIKRHEPTRIFENATSIVVRLLRLFCEPDFEGTPLIFLLILKNPQNTVTDTRSRDARSTKLHGLTVRQKKKLSYS